jgi:hypothetical protein
VSFTEPITKSPSSRGVAAADWNTYIKANLTAIKAHEALTTAVHGGGSGQYPIGCATAAGVAMEGSTVEVTTSGTGGVRWEYATWTFTRTYTVNPKVFMGIENSDSGDFWIRVTSVSTTGCALAFGSVNSGITATCHGLAIGYPDTSDPDSPYAWFAPRTWADGDLLPYSVWNSEVRDDVNFLQHRHALMTNHIHGLGKYSYPIAGQGSQYQFDFQRYPTGDKDTQTASQQSCDHEFAFTRAFNAVPAVVLAAEVGPPPMGEHLYQEIQGLDASHFHGIWNLGTDSGAPWYVSMLAVGAA